MSPANNGRTRGEGGCSDLLPDCFRKELSYKGDGGDRREF